MKRIIALMLCIVMILSSVTAAASEAGSTEAQTSETADTQADTTTDTTDEAGGEDSGTEDTAALDTDEETEAEPQDDTDTAPESGTGDLTEADGGSDPADETGSEDSGTEDTAAPSGTEDTQEPAGEDTQSTEDSAPPETRNDNPEKLTWGISHIYATFMGETMDVLHEIMEINGGMAEPIELSLDYTDYVDLVFDVIQVNGDVTRAVADSASGKLSFYADELQPEWPLYLNVYSGDTHTHLGSELLGLRINKSATLGKVPENISTEFGSGFKVDMSDLLPGMELDVLPFMIPITAKQYADGRICLGLGVNSTDVKFWDKARKGELPEADMFEQLEELFYGDPHNLDDIKGESMGLIVIFSGWAEGKFNGEDPIKGHMELYIGTGFDIKGQYAIFTWEITLTGGANGIFDFSYVLDKEDGNYHFSADEIRLGVKGGLEVYGGVGCVLASVGVYGAGSIAYQSTMYPDAEMEHLILAGELGLKAKLFGKVICTFKIISGSHDFVNKKKKSFLAVGLNAEETRDYLLSNGYQGSVGVLTKPGGTVTWYGDGVEDVKVSNAADGRRDYSHLLASDIYPDNNVQVVSNGGLAFDTLTIAFLGTQADRAPGNQSTLMSSYYDLDKESITRPEAVADDGTADFSPQMFGADDGRTYLVWQNAVEEISADMTFEEIAGRLDLAFAYSRTGSSWYQPEKVTDLAGSGRYAAGASIGVDGSGEPVIAYYTNAVSDPAGLAGTHEIYVATRSGSKWTSEKIAEVTGMINDISCTYFRYGTAVAVSLESGGKRSSAMWIGSDKVWEKSGASNGRFLGAGYNQVVFTWYKDGRLYVLDQNQRESAMTPENMRIPDMHYEIYGRYGSSSILLIGTSVKDGTGNAFGYFSWNGGISWGRVDLTNLGGNALVSHISAAFTSANEPILLYSVQNYTANVNLRAIIDDPAGVAYEGEEGIFIGEDDDRFTDTRADLYIKARKVNRHVTLTGGKAIDTDQLKPGANIQFRITVQNTGLYPIDNVAVTCDGKTVGRLSGTLKPGESTDVSAQIQLPYDPRTDAVSYTFEATCRDDGEPEGSVTVEVDPGYLTTAIWHGLDHGREAVRYQIVNHGYTNKTATILVRDEVRDVTLSEKTVTIDGGWKYDGAAEPHENVFAQDGCENVTLYVLYAGEEPGDPEVSLNRVKSVIPLPAAYGQPLPVVGEPEEPAGASNVPPMQQRTPTWVWIAGGAALTALAAGGTVLLYRRRKKGKE